MATDPNDRDHDDIPPPPPRLEQPKNRGNHMYMSPPNQRQRDVWAAERHTINGWTYDQIATALEGSKTAAWDAVHRGLRVIEAPVVAAAEQARAIHRARLEAALEVALEVMAKEHVHVSQGRVMHDGGVPLFDSGPNLAAADRVRSLSESLRKLDGLDAATKTETTITNLPQDAELQERLAAARERVAAEEQQLRGET